MGNAVAYLALLTWPLVILVMFKRMPVERAFIWSILGGYMALPQITQIGLPLLPDLDKVLIPNVTAFVVCLALVRERVAVVPQNLLARILLVLFILSPAFTVFTNTEPLLFRVGHVGSYNMDGHLFARECHHSGIAGVRFVVGCGGADYLHAAVFPCTQPAGA